MCGIFGYIGNGNATKKVFEGLQRLEYRGYDSWGIAIIKNNKLHIDKHVGPIGEAKLKLPTSNIAIGHTRWATNGGVTQVNAHPHISIDKSFALAQNGILENEQVLRATLVKKGYNFISGTDTEVIVRLIEEEQKKTSNFREAIINIFAVIKGRNTIIILTRDGDMYAARSGSPFIVGYGKDAGEIYFSSDTLSFGSQVKSIIPLENSELMEYKGGKLSFYSCKTGKEISKQSELLASNISSISKGEFAHFMLKEIYESTDVISRLIKGNKKLATLAKLAKNASMIYTIGSGTAGVAAAQIAFYIRQHAKRQVISLSGAEAAEYIPLMKKGDLLIAISQSGETADVLETLEIAKHSGVAIAAHINMRGSSMGRLADIEIVSSSGPEICVMSTKAFLAQIAWGYLFAHALTGQESVARLDLGIVRLSITKYLNDNNFLTRIKKLAKQLSKSEHIFILGKGQNLNIANEGMIKMIEGSYKHAHGMPAGDLKHYAITIIEKGVPVIVLGSNDDTLGDTINAANQVSARHGTVIGIGPQNNKSFGIHIKTPDSGTCSAIFNAIVLQLLAYYMAVELKNNVDKPRNIAKSVTVK